MSLSGPSERSFDRMMEYERCSVGAAAREASGKELYSLPLDHSTVSFTPVNQRHVETVNQFDNLRSINTNASYNLSAEQSSELISPRPRKRGRKSAISLASGRSADLEHVWEYEHEANTALQSPMVNFNNLASTKRKRGPAERSWSLEDVLDNPGRPNQGDTESVAVRHGILDDDITASHLTTPANTLEEAKKRTSSAGLKDIKNRSRLSQGTVATETVLISQKVVPDATTSQTTSYQRWSSTEDAVQSSAIVLAQTTLQQFAACRFHAQPVQEPTIASPSTHSYRNQLSNVLQSQLQDELNLETKSMSLCSSNGRNRSGDDCFEDAIWKDTPHNYHHKDFIQDNDAYPAIIPDPTNSVRIARRRHISKPEEVLATTSTGVSQVRQAQTTIGTPYTLDRCKPNSAAIMNKETTIKANERNLRADSISRPLQSLHSSVLEQPLFPEESSKVSHQCNRILPGANLCSEDKCTENESLSSEYIDTEHRLSPHDIFTVVTEPLPLTQTLKLKLSVVGEVLDYCASDDFDQGIDDDDLWPLISDPVLCEKSAAKIPGRKGPRYHEDIAIQNGRLSTSNSTRHQNSLPTVIEDDDEFYDSELDRALMEVLHLPEGTDERFGPMSSLQSSNDIESRTCEHYDPDLKFSPPNTVDTSPANQSMSSTFASTERQKQRDLPCIESVDWSFIHHSQGEQANTTSANPQVTQKLTKNTDSLSSQTMKMSKSLHEKKRPLQKPLKIGRSDNTYQEYEPLSPFARPQFPGVIRDRSPVLGLSGKTMLRTCFRIGEVIKEGGRSESLRQDTLIELFARVTYSSREPGTSRQHFHFADLFHDRPPFLKSVLENYKPTGLCESESKVFVTTNEVLLARCFGRLVKDRKNTCWLLKAVNIRPTDWEEIRWTKRVVSVDKVDLKEIH